MIELAIKQDGRYAYEYVLSQKETIKVQVWPNVQATLILTFKGESIELDKQLQLGENSFLRLLYKQECQNMTSMEIVDVQENAEIYVGYDELGQNSSDVHADYNLSAPMARAHVLTTALVQDKKHYEISCNHLAKFTASNMENYAINKPGGNIHYVVAGKIAKYAVRSSSRQSTRVLTMDAKDKVSVTPLLLIDENDVEASHACSIGEMNEEHLYYLQSRGLSKEAALGLLTLSYVLPITDVLEGWDEKQKELQDELNSKVGLA